MFDSDRSPRERARSPERGIRPGGRVPHDVSNDHLLSQKLTVAMRAKARNAGRIRTWLSQRSWRSSRPWALVLVAFFSVILGFALIWRIEWLAAIGLAGAIGVALRHAWETDRENVIEAHEVAAFERLNMKEAA
jgi:hypothetical protein